MAIAAIRVGIGAGQQPVEAEANLAIALAGGLLETGAVDHIDPAAALLDHAGGLEAAQGRTDRGALYAEHLGQELMRQGQGILVQAVVRTQEPAAAAGLNGVQGVAGHSVISLGEERLVVGEHQLLKSGACPDGGMHVVERKPGGAARDLHDIAPERLSADKGAQQAEQPLTAEDRHLGQTAIVHHIDKGDDCVMGKVGEADEIADLVQDGAAR